MSTRSAVPLCALAILLAFSAFFFSVRNPIGLDDGLRHFVMAERYRECGVEGLALSEAHRSRAMCRVEGWRSFLFAGYFRDVTLDPWFLADLSYLPFTFITNRVVALKLATLAFIAVLLLSVLPLIRRQRAPPLLACFFLLILFFGSEMFTFRLVLARPYVLMTALFFLTYYCVLQRRFLALIPLLGIATVFSHLFVFPLALCGVATLWFFVRGFRRQAALCALFPFVGILLGFLLHPYQSEYVSWVYHNFFAMPFAKELEMGAEIYSGFGFAEISVFFVIAAVVLALFHLEKRSELDVVMRKRPDIALTAVLSLGLFCAFAFWARAIDFFWPMVVLLLFQLSSATEGMADDSVKLLRSPVPHGRGVRVSALILILCTISTGIIAARLIRDDPLKDTSKLTAVASIPPGSRVVNVDWEFFPLFLFVNDTVRYSRGVDPTMDLYDPEGHALYEKLTVRGVFGEEGDSMTVLQKARALWEQYGWKLFVLKRIREAEIDAAEWIAEVREHFDADYLVLYRGYHQKVIEQLKALPDLPVFAESGYTTVFKL